MRLAAGVLAFAGVTACLLAVAMNGCTDPQPKEGYCHIGNITSLTLPDASKACDDCLTAHTQCCDAYGACEEAGASCTDSFGADFACVLDAGNLGHARESTCLANSTQPATAVYGCVKDNCAAECGLGAAACTPDPAIPSVSTPACDMCATSECCTSINACYRLRPCKLTFDCVLGCGTEVGQLYDSSDAGAGLLGVLVSLCNGGTVQAPPAGANDLPCITRCFQEFVGGSPDDVQRAGACASLALFDCTHTNCNSKCALGADAGITDAAGD